MTVADWRLGDLRLVIRTKACRKCRCLLAHDERRCRRCFAKRMGPRRVHRREAAHWADDFAALRAHVQRSNWPDSPFGPRPSRARQDDRLDERQTLTLTNEQRGLALESLAKSPIRQAFDRWEWTSEAWIELVSPPVDAEPCADLPKMLERAIWRAEKTLRGNR